MGKYSPFALEKALSSLTLLVDTREQDTPALRERLRSCGLPHRREKLDFGDYSCTYVDQDGKEQSLAGVVAIERKMSLDELCFCFGKGRPRFEREFQRAKEAGARLYLLVEDASWEDVLHGRYRSRMKPAALLASLLAWQERYNMRIIFCCRATTGIMIHKILRYALKIRLEGEEQPNEI